ncbi:MAG: PhoH family protein, partial [Hylemonella sp.]
MILRHLFSPPNNLRISHLCGPMDEHLRAIEAALQVKIAHRHEQFKIDGPKKPAQQALEVLQALYELAARPIEPATVQLMLAGDSSMPLPDAGEVLLTRRQELRARTPNQAHYLESMTLHDITFGIGPAGTGKTYLAVACAVAALLAGACVTTAPKPSTGPAPVQTPSLQPVSGSISGSAASIDFRPFGAIPTDGITLPVGKLQTKRPEGR